MKRPFIINFKNYEEVSAGNAVKLAKAAERVAQKLKVEIVIAPPQPSLAIVAKSVKVPVICQHVDDSKTGSTTGFFVPEIAKSYGAVGSLINHSEHRVEMKSIASLVERMRKLGMTSVVCARDPKEVMEISAFEPDFIAIEPPELIGSGRAVSKENPAIITKSIEAAGSRSRVICGAGITDGSDVAKASELGSHGILVASGIVKADSWIDKTAELTAGMKYSDFILAYRDLEIDLNNLITRLEIKSSKKYHTPLDSIRALHQRNIISTKDIHVFERISQIRNEIVHVSKVPTVDNLQNLTIEINALSSKIKSIL